MSPKEKANRLVGEYINIMPNLVQMSTNDVFILAKECAKIAVEEVLKNDEYLYLGQKKNTEFWNEVLTEIDKL